MPEVGAVPGRDVRPATVDGANRPGEEPRRAWTLGRAFRALVLAAVVVLCADLSYHLAFGDFNFWDDEGYFLLALREYRAHGGLYEGIRTVFYGPFYFQFVSGLFAVLGQEVDHAGARWLMLGGWAAAALAVGWAARRLRAGLLACAATLALGFPYLAFFTNEPLHATSVLLPLLAVLFCLALGPLEREPRPRGAVLAACGALCAGLLLVKINVGVFVLLAFAGAYLPRLELRGGALLRGGVALALLAVPFVLMNSLLEVPWVLDFALLVSISAAPFAHGLLARAERPWGRREPAAFLAGFAALLALSLGLCFLRGTTPAGLWRSLVVDALDFPGLNLHGPGLPPRWVILASTLAIPAALALPPGSSALAALRLLASVSLIVEALLLRAPFFSLPFVGLAAGAVPGSRPRALLGLATVLLSLQAFPIAGCQLGPFSFFATLVGVIGICDVARAIPWRPSLPAYLRATLLPVVVAACGWLLFTVHPFWAIANTWRERFTQGVALDLPGTGPMRLGEMETARYRWLAANLEANVDTFLGVPGMHSLYFWARREPLVPFYPHHWELFRRAEEEEHLARALLVAPRACVVRNRRLEQFWQQADLHAGPVKSAIDDGFRPVATVGDVELLFPRSARPQLVLTATLLNGRAGLLARHGAGWAVAVTLPALTDGEVTRVLLCDMKTGFQALDTAAGEGRRRLIVTNAREEPLLAGPSPAPLDTSEPSTVLMFGTWGNLEPTAPRLVFRALYADGRVAARVLVPTAREAP